MSFLMGLTCVSFADTESDITSQYESSAATMYMCGLFDSTTAYGFNLDGTVTKNDAAREAIRLIGAEDIVTANSFATTYTDASSEMSSYLGYLQRLGVNLSVSDTAFDGEAIMSTPAYLVLILQILGYQDITIYSPTEEIYARAQEVNLLTADEANQLQSLSFTRGAMAYIDLQALDVYLNGTDLTVYYMILNSGDLKSIAYPSDLVKYGTAYIGQVAVANAYKYMGVRYVHGGKSPRGFDCSGYVGYVMIESGIWNKFYGDCNSVSTQCVKVSKEEARAGDIVFFTGTQKKSGYTHVGIYLGNDMMIHASSSKGISVASISSTYWSGHYSTIARPKAMM